jgi:hypothetical protein
MAPAERQWRCPAAAEGQWLGRMAERRGVLGENQQRGAKAAGELGGDAWMLGEAGGDLERRDMMACGGAAAGHWRGAEEEEGEGRQGLNGEF